MQNSNSISLVLFLLRCLRCDLQSMLILRRGSLGLRGGLFVLVCTRLSVGCFLICLSSSSIAMYLLSSGCVVLGPVV